MIPGDICPHNGRTMSAHHLTKDICLTWEMLCGHIFPYISIYVRTISFFGFHLFSLSSLFVYRGVFDSQSLRRRRRRSLTEEPTSWMSHPVLVQTIRVGEIYPTSLGTSGFFTLQLWFYSYRFDILSFHCLVYVSRIQLGTLLYLFMISYCHCYIVNHCVKKTHNRTI